MLLWNGYQWVIAGSGIDYCCSSQPERPLKPLSHTGGWGNAAITLAYISRYRGCIEHISVHMRFLHKRRHSRPKTMSPENTGLILSTPILSSHSADDWLVYVARVFKKIPSQTPRHWQCQINLTYLCILCPGFPPAVIQHEGQETMDSFCHIICPTASSVGLAGLDVSGGKKYLADM